MKKYGFTLAEALIVLGLIGVVASLTTPMLITNIRNNMNASRLSATVSTLENAFTTMLSKEDVDPENLLFDTEAWRNFSNDKAGFAGEMGKFLNIEGFREFSSGEDVKTEFYAGGKGPFVLNSNGSKNSDVNDTLAGYFVETPENASGNHTLVLKNGAVVFMIINTPNQKTDEEIDAILAAGGGITSIAADIWIDVNGTESPNTLGKDIFAFYLGHNGKLYPLGGRSVGVYDNVANPLLWNAAGGRNCQNGSIAGGGYGCTARVVEEGYKINY